MAARYKLWLRGNKLWLRDNKLWLRRGTLNPGPGGIGRTKLKSTLLFGVAIHLNMKMGAKSPGLVYLVWFGRYGLCLFDGGGNFSVSKYYCCLLYTSPSPRDH